MRLLLLLLLHQYYGKNIHFKKAANFRKSVTATAMVIDPFSSYSPEQFFSHQLHKRSMYSNSNDNSDDSSNDNRSNEGIEKKIRCNSNTDENHTHGDGFLKNILVFLLTTLITFSPSSAFAITTQPLDSNIKTSLSSAIEISGQPAAASSKSFFISSISTPSPSSGGITIPPPQPQFNAPSGIRESIAKSAANIPGKNSHHLQCSLKSFFVIVYKFLNVFINILLLV
jgi:hypothetical protein